MDASSVVSLLLTGAGAVLIAVPLAWLGVRGQMRAIISRLKTVESDLADAETRISKLQKQRAADVSVDVRRDAKSLKDEAEVLLSQPRAPGRPSAIHFVR